MLFRSKSLVRILSGSLTTPAPPPRPPGSQGCSCRLTWPLLITSASGVQGESKCVCERACSMQRARRWGEERPTQPLRATVPVVASDPETESWPPAQRQDQRPLHTSVCLPACVCVQSRGTTPTPQRTFGRDSRLCGWRRSHCATPLISAGITRACTRRRRHTHEHTHTRA